MTETKWFTTKWKAARGLQLDYRSGRNSAWWTGWALLLLALAFAADLGISWAHLRSDVARAEDRLAASSRELRTAPSQPARAVNKEELAFARDTIQRIALPWDTLFGTLEAAAGQGPEAVALLSVEPDAAAGSVLVTGEARDYAAALQYVQRLKQSQQLGNVLLVKHEVQNSPGRPVAFSVSASWSL